MTEDEIRQAGIPESWDCIDCGVNTAPGCTNAAQTAQAFASGRTAPQRYDERCEVYIFKPAVWKAAGMNPRSSPRSR